MRIKNEIGKRYGKLVVIDFFGNDKYGSALWKCKCDCGNECVVRGTDLRNGSTSSCGCFQKEKCSEMGKCNRKTFKCKVCGKTHYANGLCKSCYYKEMRKLKKWKIGV